jgi:hypothetical protein
MKSRELSIQGADATCWREDARVYAHSIRISASDIWCRLLPGQYMRPGSQRELQGWESMAHRV